jgi:hypothetical protein
MAMKFDAAQSKASGRLVKVQQKDGRTIAVIAIELELALKSAGAGDRSTDLSAGSVFRGGGTLEQAISGPDFHTNSIKMSMDASGKQALPGNREVSFKISAKGNEIETYETSPAK